jgi:DNA-binding NtrC family response regulator
MSTSAKARVLVVSDNSAVLRLLWSIGESNGWKLETAASAWEAMDRVQSGVTFNLFLLDLPQGDVEELHTLRWLRRLRPSLPIILIGYPDDVGRQEESIRLGASDYLVRPLEERELESAIRQSLSTGCETAELDFTSEDVEVISEGCFFIGLSPIMRRLRSQAALLAKTDVPVLILGEDGSGKETAARLIHSLSVRSAFEFAKVRCAALPIDLLERELFGYERNSTAAQVRAKSGKLELCAKGTILLDEIAEMPLDLQSRLVKVLQNGRFIRPGTSTAIDADVRLLATSSTSIERAVSENRFDENLYRYLTAYTIHVPPLRERTNEIPSLACHFMHQLARQYGISAREFSAAIVESWKAYNWPGNLPELEQFVKRYLMVGDRELTLERNRENSEGDTSSAARAMPWKGESPRSGQDPVGATISDSRSLRSLVKSVKSEAEKSAIAAALEKTGWNRKAAARLLKVSYRTVLYKIEQYKMTSLNSSLSAAGHGDGNGNGSGHMVTGFHGSGMRE